MADGADETPVETPPAAPAHAAHDDEIHMPPNSIWPLVTAVGLTGTMLGLIFVWTSLLPFILGLLVMGAGIFMWIKDARTEYSELH
jgi:hypothetical protein